MYCYLLLKRGNLSECQKEALIKGIIGSGVGYGGSKQDEARS